MQTITTNAEIFDPIILFNETANDTKTISDNSSDEYTNNVSYLYLNGSLVYSKKTASKFYGNTFTSLNKDDEEVYTMSEYL